MWPFARSVEPPPPKGDPEGMRSMLDDRDDRPDSYRYTRMLIVFLRVLAVIWLLRGMAHWALIIGLSGAEGQFEAGLLRWQTTIVAFAILNSVAAVGLWMCSAWGAVLWLVVTLADIALPFLMPKVFAHAPTEHGISAVLICAYFAVTWLAARERAVNERAAA
jgi:hypothetical protein